MVAVDLSDEAARDELAAEIAQRGLSVDVLVNNAGFSTMGPVHKSDPSREVAMIRTDVEAVAHLCSTFVPGMVARGRARCSTSRRPPPSSRCPRQAGYAACKAFVLSYSRALAQELKGKGVTVTALCPGPVETGFAEAAGIGDAEAAASLPKFMWVSSAAVAAQAVAGMEKGRAVVIPGAPNRIVAAPGPPHAAPAPAPGAGEPAPDRCGSSGRSERDHQRLEPLLEPLERRLVAEVDQRRGAAASRSRAGRRRSPGT